MKYSLIAKPLLYVFVFSLVLPFRANAGIPTIDVANIIQSTISAIENIEQVVQLYESIDNQINQIENQVEQLKNINGDRLKDMLLNSSDYKKARRWVPKTYKDVLALYKNVGVSGYEGTTDAGWEARDEMKIADADYFYDDLDTANAKRWEQHENDGMAAVGVAESAFDRVDSVLEETEDLMADIKNSTDPKAAQDLANRMSAQTQILLAEVIRVQSSQAATQGRKQLYDHAMQGEDKKRAKVEELPSLL